MSETTISDARARLGQFWVPQDKTKVCGTIASASPDAVPADATVPADLYQLGCMAG